MSTLECKYKSLNIKMLRKMVRHTLKSSSICCKIFKACLPIVWHCEVKGWSEFHRTAIRYCWNLYSKLLNVCNLCAEHMKVNRWIFLLISNHSIAAIVAMMVVILKYLIKVSCQWIQSHPKRRKQDLVGILH